MTTPSLPTPRPRSNAELLLEVQLEEAGIGFDREAQFAKGWGRRWRADFFIHPKWNVPTSRPQGPLLVEIDGGGWVGGRHGTGRGMEADCEKQSAAAILGYRVVRVTPAQVNDGRALAWIKQALGLEESRVA